MKFSFSVVTALLLADHALAFVPVVTQKAKFSSGRYMAADMPPAPVNNDLPVIQQNTYGQPSDVRYSDFLKLVNSDRIEKVTFSADGSQLLGVDVDGARVKIEALPNDPDLLTQLTTHKVRAVDIVEWNPFGLFSTIFNQVLTVLHILQ
jgi:cell division protease FtsH